MLITVEPALYDILCYTTCLGRPQKNTQASLNSKLQEFTVYVRLFHL
jgi:hypothetical protein